MTNVNEEKLEKHEKDLKLVNKYINLGEIELSDNQREQMKLSESFIGLAQKYDLMDSSDLKQGYNDAMEIFENRNFEIKSALRYLDEEHDEIKKKINHLED